MGFRDLPQSNYQWRLIAFVCPNSLQLRLLHVHWYFINNNAFEYCDFSDNSWKQKNTDAKVNIMTTVTVFELITIIIKDNKRTPFIPLKSCKISNNNINKKIQNVYNSCINTTTNYSLICKHHQRSTGPTTFLINLSVFLYISWESSLWVSTGKSKNT